MARRTAALKPQLNQIRTWARDGRTDAWIAFQLGTTAATVQEFRSEHGLDKGGGNPAEEPVTPEFVVQTISFDTPPPVVASSDEPSADEPAPRTRRQRRSRTSTNAEAPASVETAADAPVETGAPAGDGDPAERAKRRRRRGGRGGASAAEPAAASEQSTAAETDAAEKPVRASAKRRARGPVSYQGSVVAGAVIVLDPAVARSAAWRAHWADSPAFDVVIDDDQIVLRRRSDG
ncbi:MAG: hypothetical protein QOD37_1619 [Gaiellales bacterium]|jgi:hypothetical protein|nr:hypothetical protein [Gaiellales bacterium]